MPASKSQPEWFRQTSWSADIETAFRSRLARARADNRPQYLRIQAVTLLETNTRESVRVAHRLAREVLTDYPQATLEQAVCWEIAGGCHEVRGEIEDAMAAYRNAWAAERMFPGIRTHARTRLAVLIALHGRKELAREALDAVEDDSTDGPVFPLEVMWDAFVRAALAAWKGDIAASGAYAARGLAASRQQHSGFSRHPRVGLATSADAPVVAALKRLAREG